MAMAEVNCQAVEDDRRVSYPEQSVAADFPSGGIQKAPAYSATTTKVAISSTSFSIKCIRFAVAGTKTGAEW